LAQAGAQVIFGFVDLKRTPSLAGRAARGGFCGLRSFWGRAIISVTGQDLTDLFPFSPAIRRCAATRLGVSNSSPAILAPHSRKARRSHPTGSDKAALTHRLRDRACRGGRTAAIWAAERTDRFLDDRSVSTRASPSRCVDLAGHGRMCSLRPGVAGPLRTSRSRASSGGFWSTPWSSFSGRHASRLPRPRNSFVGRLDAAKTSTLASIQLVPDREPDVHQQILDHIMKSNLPRYAQI